MSGEPLWRGLTIRPTLVRTGDTSSELHDYVPCAPGTEVEVWRAGDRPVPPTRDQVRAAIVRGFRAAEVPQQNIFDCGADAVMELLSGGVPTEPEGGGS